MDKKTLAKIKQWQEFKELDPDLKKELDSISNDEAALMDAFYNDILKIEDYSKTSNQSAG